MDIVVDNPVDWDRERVRQRTLAVHTGLDRVSRDGVASHDPLDAQLLRGSDLPDIIHHRVKTALGEYGSLDKQSWLITVLQAPVGQVGTYSRVNYGVESGELEGIGKHYTGYHGAVYDSAADATGMDVAAEQTVDCCVSIHQRLCA